MRNPAFAPTNDAPVHRACAQFASQIRPVLPLDSLAVVLVEPGGDTSRVVYSWVDPSTDPLNQGGESFWFYLPVEAASLPLAAGLD